MDLAQTKFTKVEVVVSKDNEALDYSRKMVDKLDSYLKEAREGWKKIEDGLREMYLENLFLAKEYAKAVED